VRVGELQIGVYVHLNEAGKTNVTPAARFLPFFSKSRDRYPISQKANAAQEQRNEFALPVSLRFLEYFA
jgi:hypothetical protein